MVAALKRAGGTSPEGKLAGLKAQRSALLARVAGLAEARQRLGEAEEAEREATAAIGELDAVEIAAASEWASMGASGAPPAPDLTRRAKLAANLSAAQAATAAARGAAANVEGIQAGLRAELAELEADIESAALEVMECERLATFAELIKVAGQTAKLFAGIRAHVLCLGERGRHLRDSGDHSGARRYFVEFERLAAIQLPNPAQPLVSDIDAARLQWLQRFESLRG